jgi:hypothetical protein
MLTNQREDHRRRETGDREACHPGENAPAKPTGTGAQPPRPAAGGGGQQLDLQLLAELRVKPHLRQ